MVGQAMRFAETLLVAVLCSAGLAATAQTELINTDTPWRVWLSWAPMIVKDAAGQYVLRGEKANPALTAETARLDALPPSAVKIRYAIAEEGSAYCGGSWKRRPRAPPRCRSGCSWTSPGARNRVGTPER